ncbi:MAG: class I SAM-dependent methyltransferase [Candidatus Alcyoniella australis]|nr:class I SAM-dependent methyltransferase [Candidatus Alcyoniella australis]
MHQNDSSDPGHRKFLSKLVDPLLARLEPAQSGLDYGSGPDSTLAAMLREAGHRMKLYDPFFHPDPAALAAKYELVVCSETIEHFHRPDEEFARFDALLRPGGWLGLSTCLIDETQDFANWHFRRDPTHVVFYAELTLRWIAQSLGWDCEFPTQGVCLMRKPE